MIDIHNHCKYSYDSVGEPKEMVEIAIKKGAKIYGFSDHLDTMRQRDKERLFREAEVRQTELRALRRAYPNTLVLCGIEFDYREGHDEDYLDLLERFDYDYVIQSVHEVGERECYRGFFDNFTLDEGYNMYFDEIEKSLVVSYEFQILGHFGFLFKSAKNLTSEEYLNRYYDRIVKILQTVIDKGIALEANTSTYNAPVLCVPDERILRLYYEMGGRKVTIGADAHDTDRVMQNIPEVLRLLQRIGFDCIYYFENRQERRILIAELLNEQRECSTFQRTVACTI